MLELAKAPADDIDGKKPTGRGADCSGTFKIDSWEASMPPLCRLATAAAIVGRSRASPIHTFSLHSKRTVLGANAVMPKHLVGVCILLVRQCTRMRTLRLLRSARASACTWCRQRRAV